MLRKRLHGELIFQLLALKAKIKGVIDRFYCCYGNLLWPKHATIIGASTDKE